MRGIADRTKELILFCQNLLEELHPMTLRQLHYAIFSRQEIAYTNTQKDYRRLSRVTTDARRLYRAWELGLGDDDAGGDPPELSFPGSWLVDETREAEVPNVWENASAYIDTIKRAYRRDNWQDQENHCEIWSEKATVLSSIRPLADQWGITLRTIHGFSSTGMESDTGRFFEGLQKSVTVFYLGDHDPSGRCIEEDIHRRVESSSGRRFYMVRLAIHADDIRRFNLPPQLVKETDTRAPAFRKKYGNNAATVELDALPVNELRDRIEDAVEGLLDMEAWNYQLLIQQTEFDSIARIADTVRNLPQIHPLEGTV
jgi:hypothetical protein